MAIAINDNTRQSIPFFSENQVLRAEDLNQLVNAVLGQLRQSRVFTIGLGIREGFEVEWNADSEALIVSDGYGVSSDGYGFELNECSFTHFRRPGTAFGSFVPLAGECQEYAQLIRLIADRGFELAGDLNLVEELQQGWKPLRQLTDEQGGTYCLLYLYREVSVAEPSCFNECESKGAEQAGSFHAILVPAEDYGKIFGREETEDDGVLIDLSKYAPRLPALGRKEKLVKLCELGNWDEFYASYRKACEAVIPELAAAYGAVEVALTPDLEGPVAETPIAIRVQEMAIKLLGEIYTEQPESDCPDIQYLYAWLRELILAFDALKEALNGKLLYLGGEQGSSGGIRCAFPGHLGLRGIVLSPGADDNIQVSEVPAKTDPCRTAYLPPGASPERQQLLALATALFARLKALVNPDNLLLSTLNRKEFQEVRITPDARRFPFLDGRALPFYYPPAVMNAWRVGEQPNAVAYRYVAADENHPLLFADTGWDFYRIEGHLGRSFTERIFISEREGFRNLTMIDRLEKMRDCYNLAFDVVAVRIDEPGEKESAPPIAGTDWENWYKNVRFDLLLWLGQMNTSDDIQGILPSLEGVLSFINGMERLSDIRDWNEFPFDVCSALPEELTSQSLTGFVRIYASFIQELAQASAQTEVLLLWRFDPEMAECIRKAAVAQRLFEETVWRKTFFAGFAQEHPGLVHEGGVPKGGTFVLVYKDSLDREELIQFLRGFKYPEDFLREQDNAYLLAVAVGRGWDISDDTQTKIVADFCLPYLCCGSGPVHLHYPPPPPPPVPLELTIAHEPCFSREEYPNGFPLVVTVNETGGTLSFVRGDGTPLTESFILNDITSTQLLMSLAGINFPAGKLELTATYEKGGRSETALITIFEIPRIQFLDGGLFLDDPAFEPDGRVRYHLEFTVRPTDANVEVTIQVNGETMSYDPAQGLLLVRRELVDSGFPLVIVAMNGECPDELTFDLPPLPDDIDPIGGPSGPDGDTPANPDPGVVPPDPAVLNSVLNARRSTRQNELRTLEVTDSALAGTAAFKRSFNYVSDAGPDATPAKGLNATFNTLITLAESDPESGNFVRKVGELVATSFLDKLALAGNGEDLTQNRKELLKKTVERLGELEVNVNTVFTDWAVSELYAGLDKKRLTNIGKYLRE